MALQPPATLEPSGPYRWNARLGPLILAVMALASGSAGVEAVRDALREPTGETLSSVTFMAVWCGLLAFAALRLLRLVTRIEVPDGDTLVFRDALRRTVVLRPDQVLQVSGARRRAPVPGGKSLEYDSGRLLLAEYEGLHDFLIWLRQRNPAVRYEGF